MAESALATGHWQGIYQLAGFWLTGGAPGIAALIVVIETIKNQGQFIDKAADAHPHLAHSPHRFAPLFNGLDACGTNTTLPFRCISQNNQITG
jgi:hypothetical protein